MQLGRPAEGGDLLHDGGQVIDGGGDLLRQLRSLPVPVAGQPLLEMAGVQSQTGQRVLQLVRHLGGHAPERGQRPGTQALQLVGVAHRHRRLRGEQRQQLRSSSAGSMPAAVSITSAPAGPRCTTRGAATMAPAALPGNVTGTPLAMASAAAASSAGHEGGGEPELAIGTSRPCSCWKTTQRSASVVSTAPGPPRRGRAP